MIKPGQMSKEVSA